MDKIEFYRHNLDQKDKDAVMEVLDSLFLTSGDVVKDFERKFAEYLHCKYAVGITSCTNGLFLALKYFDVKEGDEVITTPLTFMATGNAVEYCGAKPVFVDVEASTGNIDADLIEAAITPQTKVIMPVHLYGQMCDMKKIREIADKHNLKIIEDCAHCIEGSRDGVRVGELGDIAVYSFYATKNITCGEGGAISCNDQEIYDWFVKGRLHGMSKSAADRYVSRYKHYDMEFLGYKFNMNNVQAAMLVNQLDRIEDFLDAKEAISQQFDQGFASNPNINVPAVLASTKHARHLYTILVNPEKRDDYIHQMQDANIGVAVNFRALHLLKYYRENYNYKEGDFPNAEKIGDSTITLPLYPKLTEAEINYIIEAVNRIVTS